MKLKIGSRLKSTACTTEVVVVRAPDGDVDVCCGGAAMMLLADEPGAPNTPAAGFDGGSQVGKRYEDLDVGVELLCTKPGAGSLSVGDVLIPVKQAKPLPSSD